MWRLTSREGCKMLASVSGNRCTCLSVGPHQWQQPRQQMALSEFLNCRSTFPDMRSFCNNPYRKKRSEGLRSIDQEVLGNERDNTSEGNLKNIHTLSCGGCCFILLKVQGVWNNSKASYMRHGQDSSMRMWWSAFTATVSHVLPTKKYGSTVPKITTPPAQSLSESTSAFLAVIEGSHMTSISYSVYWQTLTCESQLRRSSKKLFKISGSFRSKPDIAITKFSPCFPVFL